MKKWYGGVLFASLCMLFMLMILRYGYMKNPIVESYQTTVPVNGSNPLEWINSAFSPVTQSPEPATRVISADIVVSSLFSNSNLTNEELRALQTWNQLNHLLDHTQGLPNAAEAIKEAVSVWNSLVSSIKEERKREANDSLNEIRKGKQCPHFLNNMNSSELNDTSYKLRVPCGLTQGSSITIIGIPNGLLGNFRIDLTGEPLPGEPDPPVILHYNVRLHGDKITEDPVIVQNTWTVAHDWGEEERCPSPTPEKITKGERY